MKPASALPALLLLVVLVAGCASTSAPTSANASTLPCWKDAPSRVGTVAVANAAAPRVATPSAAYQAMGFTAADATGNATHRAAWPDLHGAKVVILDHGAFGYAFGPAKEAFEALTNGTVQHVASQDAGDLLQRAIAEKGHPTFDVLYGLDNVLYSRAVSAGILQAYRPLLAPRIGASYLVAGPDTWLATPVDHGYIAVNSDPRKVAAVPTLADLVPRAKQFVTEDPRQSSVGLGFLVSTVAVFGESCYLAYWKALLDGGALVAPDWTSAYATHFSGGYGQTATDGSFLGDRPIVASYTTSPAYELYYGATTLNNNTLQPGSTFHQVETMALMQGGPDSPAAAQAWIEFTLTDAFQSLLASNLAVYPVVPGVEVASVYAGKDPAPGSFIPADFTADTLGAKVDGWVKAWTNVYETHQA